MDYNGNHVVDITARYQIKGEIDSGVTAISGDMLYYRKKKDLITVRNITSGVIHRHIPITSRIRISFYKLQVVEKSQPTTGTTIDMLLSLTYQGRTYIMGVCVCGGGGDTPAFLRNFSP